MRNYPNLIYGFYYKPPDPALASAVTAVINAKRSDYAEAQNKQVVISIKSEHVTVMLAFFATFRIGSSPFKKMCPRKLHS